VFLEDVMVLLQGKIFLGLKKLLTFIAIFTKLALGPYPESV
jgi:hypothetical protein